MPDVSESLTVTEISEEFQDLVVGLKTICDAVGAVASFLYGTVVLEEVTEETPALLVANICKYQLPSELWVRAVPLVKLA